MADKLAVQLNPSRGTISAYAVYKGKSQGDRMDEDLIIPEMMTKRKRRKSFQGSENGRKRKKISPKKRLSLQGEDLKLPRIGKVKGKVKEGATSKKRERENLFDLSRCEEGGTPPLDMSFKELFDPNGYADSGCAARALFELLINPYPLDTFFNEIWEKKPVLLRRHDATYNNGWFSTKDLDAILQENSIQYSVNINITSYENGERLTHNPVGRAYASTVWDFYEQGCSIQFLNPQTYSKEMWMLGATLQELFGSFVGANIYLTPSGTQGFAPHYDDIEAFVMQIEGKKRWRLYKPRNRYEILPRVSSKNFSQFEIGELILDVVLEPGDLLYFPRGTVHQANALSDTHSLHITLSTCQKNTWGDFLEKMVPVALQTAINEDEDFRKSLPTDYLDFMGVVHSEETNTKRSLFVEKISMLMRQIIEYAPFDAAADQMGMEFIHGSLPPCLTEKEKGHGVWRDCGRLTNTGGLPKKNRVPITLDTEVKLVRGKAIRLVNDEVVGPILYFTTNNSRVYREKDVEGMEIHPDDVPVVEYLITSYPAYKKVGSFPIDGDENKVDVCLTLYNCALLLIKDRYQKTAQR